MPTWPASLPQDQFVGLTDRDQDAVARTPMDAGPPSRRARFTAVVREEDIPIILSGAQRQTFDTFYRSTLVQGSLAFDWEDPVTDATVSLAFRSPPRWTLSRGGATANDRVWRATLELEVQP